MSHNTSQSDEDGPTVALGEPDDWARRRYAARILLEYTPGSTTSMHVTSAALQSLVDEIYAQHGISASEAVAKELDRLAEEQQAIADSHGTYPMEAPFHAAFARHLKARAEAIRNG